MAQKDGMNYAPKGIPAPVVKEGEFPFAAVGLDHGHIYGMADGLLRAGATLEWVYDPDPQKVRAFCAKYPQARPAVITASGAGMMETNSLVQIRLMRLRGMRC